MRRFMLIGFVLLVSGCGGPTIATSDEPTVVPSGEAGATSSAPPAAGAGDTAGAAAPTTATGAAGAAGARAGAPGSAGSTGGAGGATAGGSSGSSGTAGAAAPPVVIAQGAVCGTRTHVEDVLCAPGEQPIATPGKAACSQAGPTPGTTCALGPCTAVYIGNDENAWRCPVGAGGNCAPSPIAGWGAAPCGTGLRCVASTCQP